MLSFGIAKLFFTIAIIAMIWFGPKWQARLRLRAKPQHHRQAPGTTPSAAHGGSTGVEETVRCAGCGTYVPVRGMRSCGRQDCPYPG